MSAERTLFRPASLKKGEQKKEITCAIEPMNETLKFTPNGFTAFFRAEPPDQNVRLWAKTIENILHRATNLLHIPISEKCGYERHRLLIPGVSEAMRIFERIRAQVLFAMIAIEKLIEKGRKFGHGLTQYTRFALSTRQGAANKE